MSYMTHLTIPTSSTALHEYIVDYIVPLQDCTDVEMEEHVKLFINGAWLGITKDPKQLFTEFCDKKHKGIITIYTSIVFNYKQKEIRICNDAGRLMRPVLRVKNNKILVTDDIVNKVKTNTHEWNDLLTNCVLNDSVIEYIDPEEQSFSMLAMKPSDLTKEQQFM